ncbi:hypothetical protein [Streptomyces sp. NPDC056194]|uniref:hypothetical protein n=1 Tax=unclassified Streptomyces TaxID=2593676 RepID=UPI0035E2F78F
MKKTLAWAVTVVTAATCTFGAAVPATAADVTTSTAATSASGAGTDTSRLSPALKALVDQMLAELPADWQQRRDAAAARYGIHDTQWAELRDSVINPDDYQCGSTAFREYAHGLRTGIEDQDLRDWLDVFGAFDIPTYDALFFGGASKDNTFGVHGDYTEELTKEHKDLKKFWDVYSDDIQLVPMHGREVFSSPDRVARVLSLMFGITNEPVVQRLAGVVISLVNADPVLQGGDNPLFTFNAFAFSEKGAPNPAGVSDRIVMGDGILEALKAVGLGDTAPRTVLAHEFGHHVQYEDGLFAGTTLTGPEATRRTELMADAFGSYYLAHHRGLRFSDTATLRAAKSFYEVGDCGFTSPGHHGTPNQRLAASLWGASVAEDTVKKNYVLPSLKLDELFEAKLPDIVKPDAAN